jgi:hypothetical protein
VLGFCGPAVAALWDSLRSTAFKSAVPILLAIGIAISVMCASVTMAAPNTVSMPLVPFILEFFAAGDIRNALVFMLRKTPSWHEIGPERLLTLLVLPVFWITALAAARIVTRVVSGQIPALEELPVRP